MSFNIWENDFKDPIEFARLYQTNTELQELVTTLGKFRHFLMKHNVRPFEFTLMGFKIGYEE